MHRDIYTFFSTIFLVLFFSLTGNAQCAPEIPGYTNIGLLDGHNYYLSTTDARPNDAQAAAEALGGYLAVISSAEEEALVFTHIDELTYIGVNDQDSEGNLQTVNGEPFVYNNINPCSFCQTNDADNDFVVIEPWGDPAWSFSNTFNTRKYLIEIPCATSANNCGFETIEDNVYRNVGAHSSTTVTETTNGYNIQDVRFIGGGFRKLVDWDLDFNGDNSTLTDEDHVVISQGLDFGIISTLGDYYFMHDDNGLEAILLKFDFNGNTIWTRNYAIDGLNTPPAYITSRGAWEDSDGILVTGHYGSNPGTRTPFIIKTDLDGNEMWQKTLPIGNNFLSTIVKGRSSDGGYYLEFWEGGAGINQYIKIDANGDIDWIYDLNYIPSTSNPRFFVGESPDGNTLYYVDQGSGDGVANATAFSVNANTGNLNWQINLGGLILPNNASDEFEITSAVATNEGGLFFTLRHNNGNTNSFFSFDNYYGKIDASGNLDYAYMVPLKYKYMFSGLTAGLTTSEGDFILSGGTNSDKLVVVKITNNGWIAPLCNSNAPTGTCNDGIQNQGEAGIDCGGPCTPCVIASCTDGIQNQGETGVDCGGPCAPCPTTGCNVTVNSSNGNVIVTGLTSAENTKLFDANISPVWECNPWNGNVCSNSETISGLITGDTYFLSVQSDNCEEWIPIVVQGSGTTATCTDGIQNQGETGIDCGGPCSPCITASCIDGIQNQGETGVDCGGPCAPCSVMGCNVSVTSSNGNVIVTGLTSGENTKLFDADINGVWDCNPWNGTPCSDLEIISGLTNGATYFLSVQSDVCDEWIPIVVLGGGNTATCNDGIQNQGETGIDCGGPCSPCITANCTDGIQNQGETGIDCGGPCAPCSAMGCNVSVTSSNGNVIVTGLTSDANTKLFNGNFQSEWECNPWNNSPCSNVETITGLTNGETYFLSVQSDVCDEWIPIVVQGSATNLPDLTLANVEEISGTPGEVVFFTFDLINLGSVSTGSYDITSYISTDELISSDDIMEGNIQTGNTFPGTQLGVVNAITIPNLSPGNYFIILRVDDNFVIPELSETNNTAFANLVILSSAASPVSNNPTQNLQEVTTNDLVKITKVFPNPTTDELFAVIEGKFDRDLSIEIYDVLGRLERQTTTTIERGKNTIQLDVEDLNAGVYHLVIKNQHGGIQTMRFVKQRL